MAIKDLTIKDFDDFIKEGVSVVDFSADWCAPCKILKPIFKDVSGQVKGVKFGLVDVDAESELAQKFGVMSVPTLIFFKDGEVKDRVTGVLQKDDLVKKFGDLE